MSWPQLVSRSRAPQEGRAAGRPGSRAERRALGFAHVKLADLWKNDALKDVRAILQKAGPKALQAFDSRFTPAPSSIERLTVYLPVPNLADGPRFDFVFILAASQSINRDKFLKQLNKPRLHKGRFAGFYADDEGTVAVRFIDKTTIALGSLQALQNMVDNAPPQKPGPLSPALELAAGKRPVVAGLNATALPAEMVQQALQQNIPQKLWPIFMAKSVTASLDLEGDGHIHATIIYPDERTANAAEKSLGVAVDMAKGLIAQTRKELEGKVFGDGKQAMVTDFPEAAASLFGLGALQHAEDILKTQPVKHARATHSPRRSRCRRSSNRSSALRAWPAHCSPRPSAGFVKRPAGCKIRTT